MLIKDSDLHEIRILNTSKGLVSGYFNDIERTVKEVCDWNGKAEGIYITLNPVLPDLLARSNNRLKTYAKHTTSDSQITRRNWLLIDFDPVRPSGISSTDDEHEKALERAQECQDWLRTKGWNSSLLADSGNGAHLDYPVDLPNDEASRELIASCLELLALRFSDNVVEVDQKTGNASRLTKVYGTLACKGDNVSQRPHRVSRILESNIVEPISLEQLKRLAALLPGRSSGDEEPPENSHFNLEDWIRKHNLPISRSGSWKGGQKWILNPCPWNVDHTDDSAYIVRFAEGAIAAGCQHNGCSERDWKGLREQVEPGWRARNTAQSGKKKREPTQVQRIIQLSQEGELFSTPDGGLYATVAVGRHHETHAIRSKIFRWWLVEKFYHQLKQPPGSQALEDALRLLEAKAKFGGNVQQVYTRVAYLEDRIIIDLANEAWEAIEVTSTGWEIVRDPPIKFRRDKNMGAFPLPVPRGNIGKLKRFFNLADDNEWQLLVSSIITAFRGAGPYFIVILIGEEGSAKSTVARVIKAITDPSITAPLRSLPRNEQDLAIAARHSHFLCFDNVSRLADWQSDALCRLATGSGFSTRELYTDDEEVVFGGQRPVCLNGIEEFAAKGDLLDRGIFLHPPLILKEDRRDEKTFWQEFREAHPSIFGAILDVLSVGLKNLPQVKLSSLPRMADASKWITACETALPWKEGSFIEAYTGNRESSTGIALEASVTAQAMLDWWATEQKEEWKGTATDLLDLLNQATLEEKRKHRGWPKTASVLSGKLRRDARTLRNHGVSLAFDLKEGKKSTRMISVKAWAPADDSDAQADEADDNADAQDSLIAFYDRHFPTGEDQEADGEKHSSSSLLSLDESDNTTTGEEKVVKRVSASSAWDSDPGRKKDWTVETRRHLDWFLSAELPTDPYRLGPVTVDQPQKFYEAIQGEIENGPDGPRARSGALQKDLRRLYEHFAPAIQKEETAH